MNLVSLKDKNSSDIKKEKKDKEGKAKKKEEE